MSLATLLLALTLMAVGIVGYRSHPYWPRWLFVASALVGGAGTTAELVALYVTGTIVLINAFDALIGIGTIYVALRAFDVFPSVPGFDRSLIGCLRELSNDYRVDPPLDHESITYDGRVSRMRQRCQKHLRKLKSLRPPSEAWRNLRDEYVELWTHILTASVDRIDMEDERQTAERGDELAQRYGILRDEYRREHGARATSID